MQGAFDIAIAFANTLLDAVLDAAEIFLGLRPQGLALAYEFTAFAEVEQGVSQGPADRAEVVRQSRDAGLMEVLHQRRYFRNVVGARGAHAGAGLVHAGARRVHLRAAIERFADGLVD